MPVPTANEVFEALTSAKENGAFDEGGELCNRMAEEIAEDMRDNIDGFSDYSVQQLSPLICSWFEEQAMVKNKP